MSIPLQLLKNTAYYEVIYGTEVFKVQFKAELGKDLFFTVPVANFYYPTGTVKSVTNRALNRGLVFSEKLPFNVEYKNGNWYANIRLVS